MREFSYGLHFIVVMRRLVAYWVTNYGSADFIDFSFSYVLLEIKDLSLAFDLSWRLNCILVLLLGVVTFQGHHYHKVSSYYRQVLYQ